MQRWKVMRRLNYAENEDGTYDWTLLKKLLENNVMSIDFTKSDGTKRNMICTLVPNYIDSSAKLQPDGINKKPANSIRVWDIEKHGWRSFRLDRINRTDIYPVK
jgi:hypothetical protein